ncbi:uncharacterized protein N7446_004910 [Penicillium canescens]|uniref:uncharacterized protein n=1 Tax=Penicillium canescens TaxID=5083 RepID=UPI0026E0D294|nr:uncharacterized protein N7446_004910 [Penicillium canescens]KAJ6067873.1 hypothetical protein N7446_004910 [Penicillium canescens]
MLSTMQWVALVLLVSRTDASQLSAIHTPHSPMYDPSSSSTTTCTSEQINHWPTSSIKSSDTTIDTTTAVQVPPPMNTSTISTTSTACLNSTITTTIIVSTAETHWSTTASTTTTTVMNTTTDIIKDTITDTTTETTTETTTDTTTATSTITVPTTITEAPNPCPTTCSMSVGTVNLVYWPTNQPHHVYPSTYINSHLDYTFTSPSVYMIVDYLYGYNTAGRTGPSGTSVVFPLDLDQVSTIDLTNSATRQLTLNDLGTDCPQTEAPSVIATAAPNSRCDPILVAPEPVKSWASPCNACGNFGMFDPPYAVAPLTGDLVPVTTTVAPQSETQTIPGISSVTETTATPVSSTKVADTTESTSPSEEATSPVVETTSPQTEITPSHVIPNLAPSSTGQTGAASSSFSSVSSPATTSPVFNSATKESCRGTWLGLSLFALAFLL